MSAARSQAPAFTPSTSHVMRRKDAGESSKPVAFTPSLAHAVRRGGLGRGASAFVHDVASASRLLTSPAVERAEHRSGTGGEEAHVFERSELCAVPPAREERRGPLRRSRISSRPGCAFFWLLFFAQAKKSDSLLRSRSESL